MAERLMSTRSSAGNSMPPKFGHIAASAALHEGLQSVNHRCQRALGSVDPPAATLGGI